MSLWLAYMPPPAPAGPVADPNDAVHELGVFSSYMLERSVNVFAIDGPVTHVYTRTWPLVVADDFDLANAVVARTAELTDEAQAFLYRDCSAGVG